LSDSIPASWICIARSRLCVVHILQPLQEDEVGHLLHAQLIQYNKARSHYGAPILRDDTGLDGGEWVGDAAGTEAIPEGVDFVAESGVGEHNDSSLL